MKHYFLLCSLVTLLLFFPLLSSALTKDTFLEVVQTVTRESYFPLDIEQATIKALDAFTRHCDTYTRFLGPDDYKELLATTAGGYYGVGLEIAPKTEDQDYLLILQVKPDGPAAKAGLKFQDKIIAIDNTSIRHLSLEESLKKLRGEKKHSAVSLTLIRAGKQFTITLKRDTYLMNTTWSAYLPDQKITYCHISLFTHTTATSLKNILEKSVKQKAAGIIIDLRDNSGGSLQAAVNCAAHFLPRNSQVVYTKNRNDVIINKYFTSSAPLIMHQIPIFILVNQNTASAAEVLAKSLSIYSQEVKPGSTVSPYTFILGTKTFGKGSVQDVLPIGNNCALKLTTALFYLTDNNTIHGTGISPDLKVTQKDSLSRTAEISTLPGEKVSRFENKSTQPLDYESERLKALSKDHQILSAVSFIQLLNLGMTVSSSQISTHESALQWLKDHSSFAQKLRAESNF